MSAIKLSVENPCYESWQNMKPTCEGRFCTSCQKVVVDFTNMTDAAIFDYFEEVGDMPVCGKINVSQLGRPIEQIKKRKEHHHLKIWAKAAALLLLAPASNAIAQVNNTNRIQNTVPNGEEHKTNGLMKIQGTVILISSHTKEPAFNLTVNIESLHLNCITDLDGSFSFTIPDSIDVNSLVFSTHDYNHEKYILKVASVKKDESLPGYNIRLECEPGKILGKDPIILHRLGLVQKDVGLEVVKPFAPPKRRK